MVREIVLADQPVLRAKARKVASITPDLQALIDDMIETMREAPGVGLAAPQVGVSQRVIVVEYAEPPEDEDAQPVPPKLYVVINPEIVKASEDLVEGAEGCLSIPGYSGTVDRHRAVTLKGLNRRGAPVKIKAQDWLARIFQHEVDHLDGVLFIDKAKQVWRIKPEETTQAGSR